jgi:hypothetical protein
VAISLAATAAIACFTALVIDRYWDEGDRE